jgi:quercetin dioxygenase-like cupin family protein
MFIQMVDKKLRMNIDITSPQKELIPGFSGTFVHGKGFTAAYWHVEKGALLPEHSHPNEQLTQVTEGEFLLKVGEKVHHCHPGSVVLIPGNVPHSGEALTDCKITDIFSPARPEYN